MAKYYCFTLLLLFMPAQHLLADCSVGYTLPENQWQQIGLPCTPSENSATVGAILGDDMGDSSTYGVDWVLYSYDPAENKYTSVGTEGRMKPGLGYWIFNITGSTRTLVMPTDSKPTITTNSPECLSQSSGCIEAELNYAAENAGAAQFNMVSIPSSKSFLWGELRVADSQQCSVANVSGGCSLEVANAKNIFQSTAWTSNGAGYNVVNNQSSLSAWNGMWVNILADAQPNSQLRLQLPTNPQCPIFPADNPWNQDISSLPVHPNSNNYMQSIGIAGRAHADFGTVYNGAPNGIPYIEVDQSTPLREVAFLCWYAGSGAIFDLTSNALRPDSWTSADAAGLPIYPGLVRYEEAVINKEIKHALRFTVSQTQRAYIHPATHYASSSNDPNLPPMGLRVRLKQDFNIDGFSEEVQTILKALKKYGMLLADNGSDWFISGVPDPRWNDDNLSEFHNVPGSAFEAVYTGELIK